MFKRGLLRSSESCYQSGRPEMDGENKIIQPLISVGSVAEWTSRGLANLLVASEIFLNFELTNKNHVGGI